MDEQPPNGYGSWDEYHRLKEYHSGDLRRENPTHEELVERLVYACENGVPHQTQAIAYEMSRRVRQGDLDLDGEYPDEGYYGGPPSEYEP